MFGSFKGRLAKARRGLMSEQGQIWLNGLGGGAALLAILAMFVFVEPPAAHQTQSPSPAPGSYDMREIEPERVTFTASGILTNSVDPVDVLEVLGAKRSQAEAALLALSEIDGVSLKQVLPGQRLIAHFEETEGESNLISVSVRPRIGTALFASRQNDTSYFATTLNARLHTAQRHIAGTIETNLTDALVQGGGSVQQARALTAIFGYKGDIARRARPGEPYEIAFDVYEDERGKLIEAGDILYAAIGTRGAYYRYTATDTGITDYYTAEGRTADRFLSRRPLAKVSYIASGFGRRRHPIHGYMHTHTGVDYVAPMSTHVYAAGAGVIVEMGRKGGYGRYLRIRHRNGFETAYAHLSGYDRRMSLGASVSQGDLIGFVGNTGDVTGTHLHYEIIRNGRHVNPLTLPLPTGRNLANSPAELARFKARMREIDTIRGKDAPRPRIAIATSASALHAN